ncbi:phytochromobilin:ferredoxin oxidoreductase, chloroplastic isoform X2 [Durio zibethinus]|uniref:Phytochromobilin:ferredoxin oxidoreductase, chloroplastic isoform X2 n=1 Tax=Durio zibethinus TaxID=66656 RepID=A0A6P5ZUK3_DURZI|nr:phytochromobilin:ferredoxin oxidoreductase, chloroplastic isoform X2 [Durio zibethinus]
MECCSSSSLLSLSLMLKPPPPLMTINYNCNSHWRKKKTGHCLLQVSAISYQNFIHFALNETKRHTLLLPSPLQERYSSMIALDGKTRLEMLSFDTSRIRLLRSMSIEGEAMQLLPWGGKLTSESIKFFSPMVIWTKFTSSKSKHEILYSAFVEYYKVWIELMEQAVEDTDPSQIVCNLEAQHRYLTWRAEKDPGHGLLKRLIGEKLAKDLLRNFLFSGTDELGSKTFLDYFPQYRSEDGTINEKRSIVGKSFESRPWDTKGEFVGNDFRN